MAEEPQMGGGERVSDGGVWLDRLKTASRSTPRRRFSERGFSIVDTMVALCVAATLSAIAVPNGSRLFRQYQFGAAINQLAGDVARARMQAMAQNRFIRVRFLGANTYAIERSTDGATFAQYGSAVKLPSFINAAGGDTPTFDRNGLPLAVSIMNLTDGQVSKSVRVSIVGTVTLS